MIVARPSLQVRLQRRRDGRCCERPPRSHTPGRARTSGLVRRRPATRKEPSIPDNELRPASTPPKRRSRRGRTRWRLLVVCTVTCGLAGCGGGAHHRRPSVISPSLRTAPSVPTVEQVTPAGIQKIRHVVMIVQENRSFDSYFGTYPGADGIPAKRRKVHRVPARPGAWHLRPAVSRLVARQRRRPARARRCRGRHRRWPHGRIRPRVGDRAADVAVAASPACAARTRPPT